jgi:hypothetical protein
MCHHAAHFDEPAHAIAQARAVLALAAEAHPADDPYGKLIREEYFQLSQGPDGYLYHEMLEEHNQPFYFREFLEQIEAAGLQYLCPAEISTMFTGDLPATARAFLDGMPLPAREQYLDYLRGTAFRRSLVCRAEIALDRRLHPHVLERFLVGLTAKARLEVPAVGEARPELAVAGCGDVGRLVIDSRELVCPDPQTLAALRYLEERRPEFVSVQQLRKHTLKQVSQCPRRAEAPPRPGTGNEGGGDALTRFLLDAMTAGAIEAMLSAPCITSRISERPTVSPLARLEAQRGNFVTNQTQQPVRLTDLSRLVAGLLDGTRDRRALIAVVSQKLKAGHVSLSPFEEAADLEGLLEQVLAVFCRSALLVA